MLKITTKVKEIFVGIDHSVNKSAVCVLDGRGNIVKAGLFEKSKGSQKYTFSYFDKNQSKTNERIMRVYNKKSKSKASDKNGYMVLETILHDLKNDSKITETVDLIDGRKAGVIFDAGEYTRTILIAEAIRDLIKEFSDFKINIFIEGYAFYAPGNITQIAENVGFLKIMLIKEGWGLDLVQPNSVKLAITGFGGGGKEAMEYALKNRYGVNFNNDDLNDSFAIAECCRIQSLTKKLKVS